MAYTNYGRYANELDDEIIPTAIMIKNIPLDWKTDDLLHLMCQVKLPPPKAVNYLYDNYHVFRGMAFLTSASPDEARQVIQGLDYHQVSGRKLNVQYKRKRPECIARQSHLRMAPSQPTHYPYTNIRDNAYTHRQAKNSSTSRSVREHTPPAESYNLLMGYQTDPAEKEKLRRFLAQTGDYQEAVNEFAKNRVRESQEAGLGGDMEISPILGMRPGTPGELQQIADMEGRFGLGGGPSSDGSLTVKHEGEQDVTNGSKDRLTEGINLTSLKEKLETRLAEQEAELDERNGKRSVGLERIDHDHKERYG
ncbi:hypothetical protein IMSHALPRED_005860 [Imshaugia aleurites]|uniref:RRM domain-containing protein n=1 Tax=Imshaugia aleurites TaxID=172621 RepID=A0A8H3FEK5_9LECA|nr:hypothetical protein IMSHALPRED_005860 [Imshaugia aleurites]